MKKVASLPHLYKDYYHRYLVIQNSLVGTVKRLGRETNCRAVNPSRKRTLVKQSPFIETAT
jgi:hypothetical protein